MARAIMISRSDGYRLASGKEEAGLKMAETFFLSIGLNVSRISDPTENYRHGDFRACSGKTIECKRQPICPDRYPKNFIEICELTRNPIHSSGFADLARILMIGTNELASVQYYFAKDQKRHPLGRPARLSVSLTPIAAAAATVYVNPSNGWLYLYERAELLDLARAELSVGLLRGVGRSNEDTLAVKVALPRLLWQYDQKRAWCYRGQGAPQAGTERVRAVLGVANA